MNKKYVAEENYKGYKIEVFRFGEERYTAQVKLGNGGFAASGYLSQTDAIHEAKEFIDSLRTKALKT